MTAGTVSIIKVNSLDKGVTAEQNGNCDKICETEWTEAKILKNIWLISVVFFLNFTSVQGLTRLQSSLHADQGLGVIAQSVHYAAIIISSLFIAHIGIRYLRHKWTIFLALLVYSLWMVANGYASMATMVPASFLSGLTAAAMWIAQMTYFTLLGGVFAKLTGGDPSSVVPKFFGILYAFVQLSTVVGSIISSTILNPNHENISHVCNEDIRQYCAMNDCPRNNQNETALSHPQDDIVWLLLYVYLAITAFGALLVAIFVDNLPGHLVEQLDRHEGMREHLVGTLKQWRHPVQISLIPLSMYSGFKQTAYMAEFTKMALCR